MTKEKCVGRIKGWIVSSLYFCFCPTKPRLQERFADSVDEKNLASGIPVVEPPTRVSTLGSWPYKSKQISRDVRYSATPRKTSEMRLLSSEVD
jgi:hypothetical protein